MQLLLPPQTTAPLYRVRYATAADCEALAPKLSEPDLAGIRAIGGHTSLEALTYGLVHSDPCLTVLNSKGEVVAMFGTIPALADIAGLWILSSDELAVSLDEEGFERSLVPWIEGLNAIYPALFCFADARNERCLNWLRWGECQHVGTIPALGAEGLPFEHFQRHRHV